MGFSIKNSNGYYEFTQFQLRASMCLQPVINIGLDARIEILGRLEGIPAQLPTTLSPSTRVGSHPQKSELVQLGVHVRFVQLNSLRRRHLPAGVKILGDHLNCGKLLVLPTFEEIVPVAARRRLFSRHDCVEENTIELADLRYFCTCQLGSDRADRHRLRTLISVHVRPDVLSFADVDGFAQIDSQFDYAGDLLGLGVLETFLDENVVGKAPNRGREDDPGPRIPCIGQRLTTQRDSTTGVHYLLPRRPRWCDR